MLTSGVLNSSEVWGCVLTQDKNHGAYHMYTYNKYGVITPSINPNNVGSWSSYAWIFVRDNGAVADERWNPIYYYLGVCFG